MNCITQAASVAVAGCLRRSRTMPTPAFCALAVIQSLATNLTMQAIKYAVEKFNLIDNSKVDDKTFNKANYIVSQVLSIGLSSLGIQALSKGGYNLVYDMNPPSSSAYDKGALFCIVAQSTLVTSFGEVLKDLYKGYKGIAPQA